MSSLTDRIVNACRFFYPEKQPEPAIAVDPEMGAEDPLPPRVIPAELLESDASELPEKTEPPLLQDVVVPGAKRERARVGGKYSALSVGQLLSVLQHHGFAVVQYATCAGTREGGIEAAAQALHRAGLVDSSENETLAGILKAKLVDIVDLTQKDAELFERCMPPELAKRLRAMDAAAPVPPITR